MSEATPMFDFHLHSEWSYDATAPVEYYFSEAAKRGMSHIAITEHHQMDSLPDVLAAAKKYPMVNYI
ncbi:MAG: PHP domain-containing protein, partial [Lentisphaeria bacterium]|nr:PHP domain-containing protein [Lentisphaeria bacterium]